MHIKSLGSSIPLAGNLLVFHAERSFSVFSSVFLVLQLWARPEVFLRSCTAVACSTVIRRRFPGSGKVHALMQLSLNQFKSI